jgi:ribosomal protein S18 acetylase RimI-like enzyme
MNTVFQIATSRDIDAILLLMQEYYTYDKITFHARGSHDALQQLLRDDSVGRVWLIKADQDTVGYLVVTFWYSLEFHGRAAFIDEIYIREEYRGRGMGHKALEHVGEFCASRGIKALRLEVNHSNRRARELYRRTGFAEHDRSIMTKWLISPQ